MPVSQPVSAESLLITTTKSNGKYKQKFQHLPQNYRDNSELQGQFMDLIIEYMEESINWPDPDDQETFEKQLLG